jgi:hypothetical protein
VKAALAGDEALFDYLGGFDQGQPVGTLVGDPKAGGRFFYDADLTGFNFQRGPARLRKSFDFLLAQREADPPTPLAVQSIPANAHLPGFSSENVAPLLGPEIEPLLWLGNRAIVAASPYSRRKPSAISVSVLWRRPPAAPRSAWSRSRRLIWRPTRASSAPWRWRRPSRSPPATRSTSPIFGGAMDAFPHAVLALRALGQKLSA